MDPRKSHLVASMQLRVRYELRRRVRERARRVHAMTGGQHGDYDEASDEFPEPPQLRLPATLKLPRIKA